jgi:hypothetical protein
MCIVSDNSRVYLMSSEYQKRNSDAGAIVRSVVRDVPRL